MKIEGNQIKVGNILEIKSKLWKVLKTQHTQPGKGGAYLQVEMKELNEGTKMNTRFRSSENVEKAILEEKDFQFLYKDENKFIFMNNQTYEQTELNVNILGEMQQKFLKENEIVKLQFYENNPVGIELPDNVTLKVIETETVVKGQTATSSYKPAVLEGNIKTTVPPFIDSGEFVVISTHDASYVEKYKKR